MPLFTFRERFLRVRHEKKSLLCVGLDPDPSKIPSGYAEGTEGTAEFLTDIISSAAPYAAAFKPNLAFFEILGASGWELFDYTIRTVRKKAPDALIKADAKRGDIGNTARFYARTFFETYDCDALTVQPFMGADTLEPYLDYKEKGIIALCYTSNSGSGEFLGHGNPPLYELIARRVAALNQKTGNLWMVTGATKDEGSLKRIREAAPDVPFLIPGIGAQGGDLRSTLRAAGADVLINSSREILYGASDRQSVPESASEKSARLHAEIRDVCSDLGLIL